MIETPTILAEMNRCVAIGLKSLDALHIACAINLKCEYFLTELGQSQMTEATMDL